MSNTGIKLQFQRNTSTGFSNNNPVLGVGQIAIETDTSYVKLGVSSSYIDTPYVETASTTPTTGLTGATGTQGNQGISGNQGLTGAQGGTGVRGSTGNQGYTGIQGITGSIGSTGLEGFMGNQGAQGYRGYDGITGNLGETGGAGSQGPPGSTGVTGAKGYTGSQGATGMTGSMGATGPTGSQGFTGTQGSTGATGIEGFTGVTGAQGYTGITGAQGDTGIRGSQGFTGFSGSQGVTGAEGFTGVQGTTGSQGLTGYTGNQGVTGFTGTQGAQGFTGSTGPEGQTGSNGATGLPGYEGSTGSQGFTGSTGAQGHTGSTGSQGSTGSRGFTGTTGAQGVTGAQGAPGTSISSSQSSILNLSSNVTSGNVISAVDFPNIASMAIWLDGADPLATGVPPAVGCNIPIWKDKSGNGLDATAVGTVKPTYSNGVLFDGTHYYTVPYRGIHSTETGFFVVNTAQAAYKMLIEGNGGSTRQVLFNNMNIQMYAKSGGAGSLFQVNTTVPTNVMVLFTYTLSGTTVSFYNNGIFLGSGNIVTILPETFIYLGAGNNGDGFKLIGTMNEIIVYSNVLSTAQRQLVEGYLTMKWSMQSSLPTGHPYQVSALGSIPRVQSFPAVNPSLQFWFDGADPNGTGVAPALGTTLTTWVNKTGGCNAIATGSPTWSNGVVFNGSPYYRVAYPGTHSFETGFIVVSFASLGTQTAIISGSNTDSRGFWIDQIGGNISLTNVGVADIAKTPYSFTTNTNVLLEYTITSTTGNTTGNLYINGRLGGTSNSSRTILAETLITIGAQIWNSTPYPINGTISEVLIYNTVLSVGQRQQVETYLMNKWNIITPLSSNLAIWLDGADPNGTGVTPNFGTTLTTWVNKALTGAQYNATAVGLPTWCNGVILNGSPYYKVAYSGTHLTETGFIVLNFRSFPDTYLISGNTFDSRTLQQFNQTNLFVSKTARAGIMYTSSNIYSSNTDVLLEYTASSAGSATVNIYVNGILQPVSGGGGSGGDFAFENEIAIGASIYSPGTNAMNGIVREVMIYNTVLSTAQRQQVEHYLMNKWIATPTVTGLSIWLDGADPLGTGVPPPIGAVVPTWIDKSGLGRNATAVGSPTWSNGVVFNGAPYYTIPYPGTHSSETGFIVINFISTNYSAIIGGNKTGTRVYGIGIHGTNQPSLLQQNGGYIITEDSPPINSNTTVLLGYINSQALVAIYANGTLTNSNSTFFGIQPEEFITIGASFNGTNRMSAILHEALIYNTALSTSQRQTVELYLARKWNISLPGGTPPAFSSRVYQTGGFTKSELTASNSGVSVPNLYTTSISATTQAITTCPIQPLGVAGAVLSPFTAGFTYLPLLNVININPQITYSGYFNYLKAAINANTYSYGRKQLGGLPLISGIPALWLDSADPYGTGVVPSIGTTIPTWFDKSGNGRNGVAVTTSGVFSSTGIITTGTNGYNTTYTTASSNETAFVVASYTGAVTNLILGYDPPNFTNARTMRIQATNYEIWAYTTAYNRNISIPQSTQTLFEATLTSTSITSYINGGSAVTSNGSFTFTNVPPNIGGYTDGTLVISEVILYSNVLSTTQRQSVEAYLMNKWGIEQVPTKSIVESIAPGLAVWLDGADPLGTGSPPAVNALVPTWFDKSGNGYNASNTDSTTRYSSGILNTSGNGLRATIPAGTFIKALTIFVVYRASGTVPTYPTLVTRGNTTGNTLYGNPFDIYSVGTGVAVVFTGSNSLGGTNYSNVFDTNYAIHNTTTSLININVNQESLATSGLTMFTNGTPISVTVRTGYNSNWTPYDTGNVLDIGSRPDNATRFSGIFYEVLVYNTVLTTAQRQEIEQYLMNKWAIPFPAAAPSKSVIQSIPVNLTGLSVFSNLQVWLDGSDPYACGVVPANDATIPTWFDKSGNGYNGVATRGNPSWTSTGFSFTNDPSTQTSPYFNISTFPTTFQSAQTVYIVIQNAAGNLAGNYYYNNGGLGVSLINYTNSTALALSLLNKSSTVLGGDMTVTQTVPTTAVFSFTYNAAGAYLYTNGALVKSNTTPITFPTDSGYPTAIGNALVGVVSEVLIYNTVLSTTDRQSVESYLINKWNINYSNVSGLAIWLDAQDPLGTGSTPVTGSSVPVWYDKSGNGYNGTAVGLPTYSNGIVFNGFPYYTIPYAGTHSTETGFVVIKFSVATPSQLYYILSGNTGNSRSVSLNYGTTNNTHINFTNNQTIVNTTSTWTTNTRVLLEYTVTSSTNTTATIYTNGTSNATATFNGNSFPAESFITLGAFANGASIGTSPINATISEVLVYSNVLTTPQRQLIEGYLATKWSMQASLPAAHPYKSTPVTGYNPRNQYSTPSNIGYVAVQDSNVSPSQSILYYDGSNWSMN